MSYDRTAIDRDLVNFKVALEGTGKDISDTFMPVVAPASAYWLANEYYKSDEEFVYAIADVLHEEYQAIIESGAFLQVDDAVLMHEADTMLSRGQSWADYRAWARVRVDALNHALRGLPEDRIRYHICFGSWHGPHAYDPPLRDSIDLVLAVNAKYYLMEQANPRHEHEWKIWEDVPLPDGKVLVPGVVTHHTNVVEHPELVAQRLIRLAKWSAGTGSWAGPTAALPRGRSCTGCTRRSSGRSWPPSSRARGSPPASCGARRRTGKPAFTE